MTSWYKSSHSNPTGNCVELKQEEPGGAILMRDSKDPSGPVLTFTPDEIQAFVLGAKGGEFDHYLA